MRDVGALPGQLVAVDANARGLHVGQHADQRPLQLPVQVPQLFLLEFLLDDPREREGDLRVLGRVFGDLGDIDLVHRQLLGAGADQVADWDRVMAEELFGQHVEAVSAGPGVEQIIAHHRIQADFTQLDPVLPQHQDLVLDVLVDDHIRSVLQVGLQRLEHPLGIERALPCRAAHGQVVSEAFLPAEGPADDLGPQRVDVGRLQVDGKRPLPGKLANKLGKRRFVIDDLEPAIARRIDVGGDGADRGGDRLCGRRLLLHGRVRRLAQHEGFFLGVGLAKQRRLDVGGRFGLAGLRQQRLLRRVGRGFASHFVGEPSKAQIGKESSQPRAVGWLDASRLPVDFDRQVGVQLDQLAAGEGLIGEILQILFELCAGRFVGVLQHFFERAKLLQQRGRFLRADERNAGDIVDGIAHERLKIDHLVGPHAPVELERGRVVERVLADVEDLDERPQELADVLVTGDDPRLNPALAGQPHDGGDDVVGLPARITEGRDAEALQHLEDPRDLRRQVDGDLGAVGLVVGEDLVANGGSGDVQGTDQISGPRQGADCLQVAGEAEDGVRRLSARSGHLRDRVEDLEDERIHVDDK